jgi:hypothetical protein
MSKDTSWLSQRRFLALLVTLLLLLAVYPVLHDAGVGRVFYDVLVTLVLAAAFFSVFPAGRLRLAALLLGLPTLVGLWTGYAVPGAFRAPWAVALHGLAALFLTFAVGVLMHRVYRAERVTADSVYAACCGYLLLAVFFGHVYCMMEWCRPGSFRAGPPDLAEALRLQDRLHFVLTYFSLITLTTLGYGDIVPASAGARGLAALEGLLGQLYIAVLLAELIGKRVAQALSPGKPD